MSDPFSELVEKAVDRAIDRRLDALAASAQPRLMSIDKAAQYLDCSVRQVRYLVAAGVLEAVRWPDEDGKRRKPYFDRRDLDAVIDRNKGVLPYAA